MTMLVVGELWSLPFDFDAGGFRAGKRMQLLHTHACGADAGILEAGDGNARSQGLGEIDMAGWWQSRPGIILDLMLNGH
ncbi:MAG TPA: hypothetical protein VGM17_02730 [Rhizomicrobium sp.]